MGYIYYMALEPTDRIPIRLSVEDQKHIIREAKAAKMAKTEWVRHKLGLPPSRRGRPEKKNTPGL